MIVLTIKTWVNTQQRWWFSHQEIGISSAKTVVERRKNIIEDQPETSEIWPTGSRLCNHAKTHWNLAICWYIIYILSTEKSRGLKTRKPNSSVFATCRSCRSCGQLKFPPTPRCSRAFVGQPLEFFSKTAQRWLPCASLKLLRACVTWDALKWLPHGENMGTSGFILMHLFWQLGYIPVTLF